MYKHKAYIIKNRTNLHAGSGDTNYGIVDKEVQRDTISTAPVIHASSLKGALRYHFESLQASSNASAQDGEAKPFTVEAVFGSEEKQQQGMVRFSDARLLFLPLRSDKKPFYHVTSLACLEQFVAFLQTMNIAVDLPLPDSHPESYVVGAEGPVVVENVVCAGRDVPVDAIKKLFGIEHLAIFNDEDFNEALTSLPVIARNSLEDGKSVNLWYEEVVPRESLFYTVLSYYDNFNEQGADRRGKVDKTYYTKAFRRFEEQLLTDLVQIGANESIGYGVCTFSSLGGEA